MALTKIHKASGWKRTAQGFGRWLIEPTDDSGPRTVEFLSAGTWQNLPTDRREDKDRDRVVLIEGDPLPPWAMDWLTTAVIRSTEQARERLRAAIDDADWNESSRDGW
jgi:hypothetical protein